MGVSIKVTMKSGKEYLLDKVSGDMTDIQRQLNKVNFMGFGPIILNCSEIVSIEEIK